MSVAVCVALLFLLRAFRNTEDELNPQPEKAREKSVKEARHGRNDNSVHAASAHSRLQRQADRHRCICNDHASALVCMKR